MKLCIPFNISNTTGPQENDINSYTSTTILTEKPNAISLCTETVSTWTYLQITYTHKLMNFHTLTFY